MPLRMTDKYFEPVFDDLQTYFYDFFWKEILELLHVGRPRVNRNNDVVTALLEAIREGRVTFDAGVFRGRFDAKISRELSHFATFDARTREWRGNPPPEVKGAAIVAKSKAEDLSRRITSLIDEIPARVAAEVDRLQYSIEEPLFSMNQQANQDLRSVGIDLDITPELQERLLTDYTNNQNLNIKNWTPEQVTRLRDMIQKNALRGYNREELRDMIASEYGVTMNKARFLARQETSLFMATVRDTRYQTAGVNIVQWSTAGDQRVVGNPAGLYPDPTPGHGDHYALQGKFCLLSDPTVYADTLDDAIAGKWKSKAMISAGQSHAGVEFGCRCTYKPVLV